ncbi:cell division cycle protein 16 homolog [Toxorhynchites rutilus septentrionalis]|uniref:cell division cycle protein 16 homolog n=1 Tax=Toxorhynchites rutilus septentrionalis TaxID=329112 RepID=UPI0024787A93|nr:cell division cycle protein 16 homolog [Toxorhynchites rutilus septentrionalis]
MLKSIFESGTNMRTDTLNRNVGVPSSGAGGTVAADQTDATGGLVDVDAYRRIVKSFMDMRRYQTALFWAEKVTVLSNNDPRDVYWLAQCMFLLREFHRAAYVIRNRGLDKRNLLCHYLAAECLTEAKEYQEALDTLNSVDCELLANSVATSGRDDSSTAEEPVFEEPNKNDVLASIYFLKGKILEAMDNRILAMDCYVQALHKSVYCSEALDALVQHEMLMAWEEKELMQHIPMEQQCSDAEKKILKRLYESKLKKYYESIAPQTNIEQTPVGTMSTDLLHVLTEKLKNSKNIESNKAAAVASALPKCFTTPVPNKIMSPANKILEEIKNTPSYLIQSSLSKASIFRSNPGSGNASKQETPYRINRPISTQSPSTIRIQSCIERLDNCVDLVVSTAEKYFYNSDYKKCMKMIDEILKRDPYHKRSLTVQIGCLMEMKDFNKLFYVAHKLVDFYPDDAISWYAVGCYYDLIGKSDPARRYLSKATTLDRLYGPAWLAYGHSFAKENEHDQAMAAYFKATQLMRGCHLPLLYIGVECGLTKNLEMAEKFFYQAMSIAPLDVYVLHELGVIKFEYELYDSAEEVFRTTLDMVQSMARANQEPISVRWEPLLNNLGHCCRKNKKYEEALEFHRRALFLKPLSASTYTAIGFVQALMGKLDDAVESFHKSLSLKRDDVFTTTILKYAIEDLAEEAPLPFYAEEADDIDLEGKGDDLSESKDDEMGGSCGGGSGGNEGSGIPGSGDGAPTRLKLKFDEYDSNASPVSDTSADDMSMDL